MSFRAAIKGMPFALEELAAIDAVAALRGFEEAGCAAELSAMPLEPM